MDDFLKRNMEVVFTFRRTLSKETDRGCALMAAAFLENELESLIRLKLIGTKSQIDEMFEFNGPIGTFSSKIKMAYALGLISEQISKDFDLIRRIRNEFGHDYKPIDFTTPAISSRIDNLKEHFFDNGSATNRQIFNNTVLGVLAHIHAETARAERFKARENSEKTEEFKKNIRERSEIVSKQIVDKLSQELESLDSSDKVTQFMFEELLKAHTPPAENLDTTTEVDPEKT
jgi:DNA-binding MltR family transcriptional regulator